MDFDGKFSMQMQIWLELDSLKCCHICSYCRFFFNMKTIVWHRELANVFDLRLVNALLKDSTKT